jgi:hypothetical protein
MSTSDYPNTQPDPADTAAQILSPITQALTKHGITLDRLSGKLNELIDCKKGDDPDNASQLKAVDIALKLQQAYPAEKKELTINPIEQLTDTELDERIKLLQKRADESGTDSQTGKGEG